MTRAAIRTSRLRGPALVLGAAVLWGTVGPAQVWLGAGDDPAALGAARILIGGLVLAAAGLRSGNGLRALARRKVWPWLLVAALATGIYQAGFMLSVSRAGAALATAVALGVAPVATGTLARLFRHERLGAAWTAGTAAATAGCVLLLAPGAGQVNVSGVILGILSGFCYGIYTVAAKQLTAQQVSMPAAVSATLLIGGLAISPALITHPPALANARSLALLAWLGLAATALAYLMFVAGLKQVPASTAGTLSLAEPLVAAILGLTALGERLTPLSAAGLLLLLSGMIIVSARPWRRAETDPTETNRDAALTSVSSEAVDIDDSAVGCLIGRVQPGCAPGRAR